MGIFGKIKEKIKGLIRKITKKSVKPVETTLESVERIKPKVKAKKKVIFAEKEFEQKTFEQTYAHEFIVAYRGTKVFEITPQFTIYINILIKANEVLSVLKDVSVFYWCFVEAQFVNTLNQSSVVSGYNIFPTDQIYNAVLNLASQSTNVDVYHVSTSIRVKVKSPKKVEKIFRELNNILTRIKYIADY